MFTRTHSSILYTSVHSTSGLIIFGRVTQNKGYYSSLTKRGKSSLSYLPILPFFLPVQHFFRNGDNAIIFLAFEFITHISSFLFLCFLLIICNIWFVIELIWHASTSVFLLTACQKIVIVQCYVNKCLVWSCPVLMPFEISYKTCN